MNRHPPPPGTRVLRRSQPGTRTWMPWAFSLCVALASPRPASAQTIEDAVREHVEKELEEADAEKDSRDRKKQPEPKPRRSPARRPQRRAKKPLCEEGEAGCFRWSSEDQDEKPEREGPELPVRVLHENLLLDLMVGGGYRGWYAEQYPSVSVDVGTYYTWKVGARVKLFKYLAIKHAYYESNGVHAPRTKRAARAGQIGQLAPKAAWLIGALGVPAFRVWEPTLLYEARTFETRGRPHVPVCIAQQDTDQELADCPRSDEPLVVLSGFETLLAGVTYHASRNPSPVLHESDSKAPPIFFGAGFLSYRKPYQVTVDGDTLEDLLFDAQFRGGGIALGTNFNQGVDGLFGDLSLQVGLGQIRLTEDLSLGSVLPDDWRIGYALGDLHLGYRWALLKRAPTLILVPEARVGGALFYFFETKLENGEELTTALANYDLLWGAQLSLIIPL